MSEGDEVWILPDGRKLAWVVYKQADWDEPEVLYGIFSDCKPPMDSDFFNWLTGKTKIHIDTSQWRGYVGNAQKEKHD